MVILGFHPSRNLQCSTEWNCGGNPKVSCPKPPSTGMSVGALRKALLCSAQSFKMRSRFEGVPNHYDRQHTRISLGTSTDLAGAEPGNAPCRLPELRNDMDACHYPLAIYY